MIEKRKNTHQLRQMSIKENIFLTLNFCKFNLALVTLIIGLTAFTRPAIIGQVLENCPVINEQPKVDGEGNESCWSKAAEIPYFVDHYSGKKVLPATKVKLFTDGRQLYIFAQIRDAKPLPLKRSLRRDKVNYDTLQLYLAPQIDNLSYYKFAFDSSGAVYDTLAGATASDYNFYDVKHAVKRLNNGWNLELAMPFKDFGLVNDIKPGKRLGFNLVRVIKPDPKARTMISCWSPTIDTINNPKRFGHLIIGSYADCAKQLISRLLPKQAPKELHSEVLALRNSAQNLKTAAEYKEFEARVLLMQRKINAANFGNRGLVFWQCNPWDLPAASFLPQSDDPQKIYHIDALQNEFVSFALGVANHKDSPVRIRCVPTTMFNLKTGETANLEKFISLRRVVTVGLRGGISLRDALPDINLGTVMDLRPYSNEVVWLEVDTRKIPAGEWIFALNFEPLEKREFGANAYFRLNVAPLKVPNTNLPYTYNWMRPDPPIRNMPEACFKDMREHYINTYTGTRDGRENGFASLRFDKDGRLSNEPDFTYLRKWIEQCGPDSFFFIPGGGFPDKLNEEKFNPKIARENFKKYIDALYKVVDEYKIPKERFAWYAVDEPNLQKAKNALPLLKMLKQARPDKYEAFVTFCPRAGPETIKLLVPYVTYPVIKLSLGENERKLIRQCAPSDANVMGYGVLGRTDEPYRRYRLSPLLALKRGYKGVGFWNYNDMGRSYFGDAWDDFSPPPAIFAMVYSGTAKPIPSVRWEAWRQGIIDWKYFSWIKQELSHIANPELKRQAELLCKQVLNAPFSSDDKSIARKMRAKMRRMLLQIKVGQKQLPAAVLTGSPDVYCLTGNGRRLPNRMTEGTVSADRKKYPFTDSEGKVNNLFNGSTGLVLHALRYSGKNMLLSLKRNHHINWVLFYTWNGVLKRKHKYNASIRQGKSWEAAGISAEDVDPYHIWHKFYFGNRPGQDIMISTSAGTKKIGELLIYGY
jgi:hypothetical protein